MYNMNITLFVKSDELYDLDARWMALNLKYIFDCCVLAFLADDEFINKFNEKHINELIKSSEPKKVFDSSFDRFMFKVLVANHYFYFDRTLAVGDSIETTISVRSVKE